MIVQRQAYLLRLDQYLNFIERHLSLRFAP